MYTLYKTIKLILLFKKEIRDFKFAAKFHELFQTDEDERNKAVGQSLMSAEQSESKLKVAKQMLRNTFKK